MWVAPKRAGCLSAVLVVVDLFGRGVLGDGLGALADGVMLGQLARKQQTNGRLDLTARDRRAPVVVRQSRRLGRDALEDVHEAVHDAHRLAADSRVRMNLLQHLVHVHRVTLTSPVLSLLVFALLAAFFAPLAPFDAIFGGISTSNQNRTKQTE